MNKLKKAYLHSYKLDPAKDRDYFDLVEDLYFSPQVQSLKQYEQHLEINRLQHITSVSYLSFKIAKKLGWHPRETARGTLLHDLFYYDWRDPTGMWHRPHGYKHPRFAALNARELDKTLTDRQENMILRHMFPLTLALPRYKEGYILIFADKYCANRELIYSKSKKYKAKIDKLIEV